jgi:hypothetical protein
LRGMSVMKDITQLGKLVAAKHGWSTAKAFKAYEMSEADRAAITGCAVDLLKVFPTTPGACALMSAAFAVQLERFVNGPVQVIFGTLTVEGVPVFGDRSAIDAAALFSAGDLDWAGHAWVMIGPYIADISIFRTAYSRFGPAILSRHIDLKFGPNKGLYVDHWKRTRQVGLGYEPQYVLSADEVTRLMGGAFKVIQDHNAGEQAQSSAA